MVGGIIAFWKSPIFALVLILIGALLLFSFIKTVVIQPKQELKQNKEKVAEAEVQLSKKEEELRNPRKQGYADKVSEMRK